MEVMKITETWVKIPQGGSFIYEYKTTGSLFEIKTNNVTVISDISHKLYIPEDVDVEIRSISGEKKISFVPVDSIKPTKEFLEDYGDLLNLINEKTQEQNSKIDNVSKELESKTELLATIENKADRADFESFKDTVNQNQTRLQRELLSHSDLIDSKIGESRVKELISNSEINTLTLSQVQQEITKNISDKVSKQEMTEANQAQDIKIETNKVEVAELKDSVSEQKLQLQEGLQSLEIKIGTKLDEEAVRALIAEAELNDLTLDEVAVKALIAEAELDDLTLEQVQQEIITRVVDKASSQAVAEANEVQDAKIEAKADTSYVDNIKQSLENKDSEIERSLDSKANALHTHSITDITGLNDRLSALVSNDALQNLLKQYSPIAVKTDVEQLQNSLATKADNIQLESLQELIQSVSDNLEGINLNDLTDKASKDEVNTLEKELTTLINAKANATALSAYMTTEQAMQLLSANTSTATQVNVGNGLTDVVVMTGVIEHGETIPLPYGFTESQCKWMVSISDYNIYWSVPEGTNAEFFYGFECSTIGRVVKAQSYLNRDNFPGRAKYIIIGVK